MQEDAATDDDTSSLIPALLVVLGAYVTYRGVKSTLKGPWTAMLKALDLHSLIGGAMQGVAERALDRQRKRGTNGAKGSLLPYADDAAMTSVESQMRTLVHALQYYQRHPSVPLPNSYNPPEGLAEQIAVVGRNTAQLDAELRAFSDPKNGNTGSLHKNWITMADSHVRTTHQFLGSTKYESHSIPVSAAFRSIDGAEMNFPGDMSLGAPLEEIINCFVDETEVSAPDVLGAMRSEYSGELITIRTRTGRILTGTPNHPMLSERGWVRLGSLNQGDQLVCTSRNHSSGGDVSEPDVDDRPAKIGQVFRALHVAGNLVRVSGSAVNFHGDRPDGDVDVVAASRLLSLDGQTSLYEHFNQRQLILAGPAVSGTPNGDRPARQSLIVNDLSAPGFVGGGSEILAFVGSHPLHPSFIGGGSPPDRGLGLDQPTSDDVSGDSETVSDALLGLSGEVSLDDVLVVERQIVISRQVFNLNTVSGIYLASGIVTHNCRCFLTYTRSSQFDPNEPQYLPAYWIHKKRGDQPHNEQERRNIEDAHRAADAARREAIYLAKFGPKPVAAASG